MSRLRFVPYLYLLRVQILTAITLIGLPIYALYPQPSTLLNGLFDLDYARPAQSALAMGLVTLSAFSTAWTLLATTWSAATNAPERFGAPRIPWISFPIRWPECGLFAVAALPAVVGAIRHSWWASDVSRVTLLLGAFGGMIAAVALLLWANRTAEAMHRAMLRPEGRLIERPLRGVVFRIAATPGMRDGYVDEHGHLRPGHFLALLVFTVSVLLYVAIGVSKFVRVGYPAVIPTLAAVLLLVQVLCWAAAGLAFFFDRYRVPVLVPLLALPVLSSWLPQSDHFYRMMPRDPSYSASPGQLVTLSNAPLIIVAADGGGIQAAAWAARVLSGLDLAARPEFGDGFARSVRMISAVSGGGIGAMYFVNQYHDGRLRPDVESILKHAEASSLDDLAWGAAYPDLLRMVLPVFQVDRGQALEWAWTRDGGVAAPLGQWRDEVYGLSRPALIFNATLVDSGERLLIGSARVGWGTTPGQRNFEDLYPGADLQVVTAARLSSTFTYVTPAARANLPGRQFHVVDGGYYDNYGMTTLMEWLEQALEESNPRPSRVLVIQIRSTRPATNPPPGGWHGWFYQAWAPLEAMLNVRTTGQLSHNEQAFRRMQQQWAAQQVEIDNAVFQFCGERPPLSWHLTGRDKQAIDERWQTIRGGGAWQVVRAFLAGQPVPSQPAWIPCG